MKANGEFTNRSTVRAHTRAERVNAALFQEQEQFLASVEERSWFEDHREGLRA